MYSGHIVETGRTADVLQHPLHPYTKALIEALPRFQSDKDSDPLRAIPGIVPDPAESMAGCRFSPRCARCGKGCDAAMPPRVDTGNGHIVYCFYPMRDY